MTGYLRMANVFTMFIIIYFWRVSPLNAQTAFSIVTNNAITTDVPSANYNGAAWVDFDHDGDPDLYAGLGRLFRNEGNGSFTKVDAGVPGQGFNDAALGKGISFGDVDNDGNVDAFVTTTFGSRLYLSNGASFSGVTTGAIGTPITGWTGALGDYDNDGLLDLVVAAPLGFDNISHSNLLFHNEGNGQFTRIDTTKISLANGPYTVPSWFDYDQDGDIDLFIGSGPATGSPGPDFYYKNLLKETGTPSFIRMTENFAIELRDGQNVNWIDYDNDGDFDFYVTNYGSGNASIRPNNLYRNDGNGIYTKITSGSIVTDAQVSLGNLWEDFDNDGDADCFVSNEFGFTSRYYMNNADGSFTAIDTLPMVAGTNERYGASAADYDSDGDLDLFVFSPKAVVNRLFRNELSNGNHWINFNLEGRVSNRSAIGAIVKVKAMIQGNSRWQMRQISAQNSFNGHSVLEQHFGLGDATTVDTVLIIWPSGVRQILTNSFADQTLTIVEDTTLNYGPNFKWIANQSAFTDSVFHLELSALANPAPHYQLVEGPAGLTVDSISGLLTWIPSISQAGTQTVTVRAVNNNGSQLRSFTIQTIQLISPTMQPIPARTFFANSTFRDTVGVTANPPAVFHLQNAPSGMAIDSITGVISWTTNAVSIGQHDFRVTAKNIAGTDTISLLLTVVASPTLHIFQNPAEGEFADLLIVSELPLKNSPAITIVGKPGNISTQLIASGSYTFKGSLFLTEAQYRLQSTVIDTNNFSLLINRTFNAALSRSTAVSSLSSPDAQCQIDFPVNAFGVDTYVISHETDENGFHIYAFTAPTDLLKKAQLVLLNNTDGIVYQETNEGWKTIPTISRNGDLIAQVTQLGRFRVEKSVDVQVERIPSTVKLIGNFPNPFNPSTTIAFELSAPANVRLVVYNMLGQIVREVVNDRRGSGVHRIIWDGRNQNGVSVSSGIYLYRLEAGSVVNSGKMLLIK